MQSSHELNAPGHILIVDDEPLIIDALARLLRAAGYRVTEAVTGNAGLQAAQQTAPDLILLDVNLPDVNSLDACRQLKTAPATSSLYVVLFSGQQVDSDQQAAGLESGADGYLTRPISDREFLARIQTFMRLKQAEDALRQSEARYRRITTTLTDYIYTVRVVDGQPVETRHGPGCVAITGYTPEEFTADPYLWFRMVAPEDRPRVQAQAQQVVEDHNAPTLEHRLVRKDGAERWVRNTPVPHHDEHGRLISYDGLIQDITDRRRAEEALKVSEARYRSLIETQVEIIARSDLAGRLTFVNEAYCRMFGKSPAELIGSSFISTVWPDDAPISLATLIALEQPPYRASTETRHFTPQGLRWINWENTAIVDDDNRLLELQGAGRDITDRKQAEAQMRQQGLVLDQIQDQVMLTDLAGVITYVNDAQCRALKKSRSNFIGRPVVLYRPDARQEHIEKDVLAAVCSQGSWRGEVIVRTAEDEDVLLDCRAQLVYDETGQPAAICGIGTDITARKAAEEALRATRDQLVTITDNIPILIAHFSTDQRLIYVNEGYSRFFQKPIAYFTGRHVREIIGEEGYAVCSPYIARVLQGEAVTFENAVPNGAGEQRATFVQYTPQRDAQGLVIGYFTLIQDITERQQIAEALRQSERRLLEAQAIAHVGNWELDLATRIVWASEEAFRIYGLEGSGALPLAQAQSQVHPDDRPRLDEALLGVIRENRKYDLEFRLIRTHDHALRFIHSWAHLVYDAAGTPRAVFGVFQDVTDRKAAEEALRESEMRFRETLDYLPVAISLSNGAGENIYFNQAFTRLYGYTREDLPTLNDWWLRAYPDPAYRSQVQAVWVESLAKAIRAGTATEVQEIEATCKDGTLRQVALRTRLLGDLYIVSSMDITERKEMEAALRKERGLLAQRVEARTVELSARTAELQQANAELVRAGRLKDEFLANMSHELRTPLTAILGLAEALQMGSYGPLPDLQSQMLQVIRQSGQHLLALITDILDLSKIEAGKADLHLAPSAVGDICQSSLHFINQPAQKKNIRVTFVPDPLVRLILTDARRLKQMVVNLLANAVKFTPEGGQVGLEVVGDSARREVRFIVWDTGIGIPLEKQGLLFRPFVQVDGGLNRQYEGAGLGLALTRRLAEMQGGQVTAESGGTGQGSRFTITLPWRPAETPGQLSPSSASATRLVTPTGRPAVVLLADDNQATLTAVGDFLQSLSAKVVSATDGQTALAQAQAVQPDLIVLDIHMPGLDGLETIRQLRTAPETAHTPIIALTALAVSGDRERCLNAGANEYLSKPVRLNSLIDSALRLIAEGKRA